MEEAIKPFEIIAELEDFVAESELYPPSAPAPAEVSGRPDELLTDLQTAADDLHERFPVDGHQALSNLRWLLGLVLGIYPDGQPAEDAATLKSATLGRLGELKRAFHRANQT